MVLTTHVGGVAVSLDGMKAAAVTPETISTVVNPDKYVGTGMTPVAFGGSGGINKELDEGVDISVTDGSLAIVVRTVEPSEAGEVDECSASGCDTGSFVTTNCPSVSDNVMLFVSKAMEGTENKYVVMNSFIPAVFSANDLVTLRVVRPLIPSGADSVVVVKCGVAGVTLDAGSVELKEMVESGTCLDKTEIFSVALLLIDVNAVDCIGVKNATSCLSVGLTAEVFGTSSINNEGDAGPDS